MTCDEHNLKLKSVRLLKMHNGSKNSNIQILFKHLTQSNGSMKEINE